METTTETNTTVTPTDETTSKFDSKFGCYAVIAHQETGQVQTVYAKTKANLGKNLHSLGDSYVILGVFKGKELKIEKKTLFSFN